MECLFVNLPLGPLALAKDDLSDLPKSQVDYWLSDRSPQPPAVVHSLSPNARKIRCGRSDVLLNLPTTCGHS
jgi:hypothetical protein